MDYIGSDKARSIFLGLKPILSQIGHKLRFLKIFNMLSESVRDICMTSPGLLLNLEIVEFCDLTSTVFVFFLIDNEKMQRKKWLILTETISQLIKCKLQYIVRGVLFSLNVHDVMFRLRTSGFRLKWPHTMWNYFSGNLRQPNSVWCHFHNPTWSRNVVEIQKILGEIISFHLRFLLQPD